MRSTKKSQLAAMKYLLAKKPDSFKVSKHYCWRGIYVRYYLKENITGWDNFSSIDYKIELRSDKTIEDILPWLKTETLK